MHFSLGLGLGSASAAGGDAGPPSTFADDFQRANGPLVDDVNWFGSSLSFNIVSGNLQVTDDEIGTARAVALSSLDCYVNGVVAQTNWQECCLIARYVDDLNWIGVTIGTSIVIQQRLAGSVSNVATTGSSIVAGDVVEIRVVGDTASVRVNDVEVIASTAISGTLAAGDRCGVYSSTNVAAVTMIQSFECGIIA